MLRLQDLFLSLIQLSIISSHDYRDSYTMIGQGLTVILPQSHKVNTVGVSNFKMAVLHFVNVTKEEIKSDIRKFHSTKHNGI